MGNEGFGGEVFNHMGQRIFITYEVYKRLKKCRVVDGSGKKIRAMIWNKPFHGWQLTALALSLMDLWEVGPEFNCRVPGAMNPERIGEGGPPKDGGRANRILSVLGRDLSGLPVPAQTRSGGSTEGRRIKTNRPLRID